MQSALCNQIRPNAWRRLTYPDYCLGAARKRALSHPKEERAPQFPDESCY
jgi:hypothetical protein